MFTGRNALCVHFQTHASNLNVIRNHNGNQKENMNAESQETISTFKNRQFQTIENVTVSKQNKTVLR